MDIATSVSIFGDFYSGGRL